VIIKQEKNNITKVYITKMLKSTYNKIQFCNFINLAASSEMIWVKKGCVSSKAVI